MNLDDTLKFLEMCSNSANPWPKTDTRYWVYELGYTRALLASIIKDDAIQQHRIKKHSLQKQQDNRSKKQS